MTSLNTNLDYSASLRLINAPQNATSLNLADCDRHQRAPIVNSKNYSRAGMFVGALCAIGGVLTIALPGWFIS